MALIMNEKFVLLVYRPVIIYGACQSASESNIFDSTGTCQRPQCQSLANLPSD